MTASRRAEPRNPLRVEGLIALAQALNGPTRAALCSLRAAATGSGAESVLTWQTGYPVRRGSFPGFPRVHAGRRGLDELAAWPAWRCAGRGRRRLSTDRRRRRSGGIDTVVIGPGPAKRPSRSGSPSIPGSPAFTRAAPPIGWTMSRCRWAAARPVTARRARLLQRAGRKLSGTRLRRAGQREPAGFASPAARSTTRPTASTARCATSASRMAASWRACPTVRRRSTRGAWS